MQYRMFTKAFILLLTCSGLASAQTEPTFYARTDLIAPAACQIALGILQIGDFNRDGIPDLLCRTMQLGNGDGTFRPGPAFSLTGTALSSGYAVDVNGDGTSDVVYAEFQNGRLGLAVMLGNGDATFQSARFYPSTSTDSQHAANYDAIVFYDFNGDGVKDAVLMGSAEYIFFAGRANGSFQASPPVVLTSASSLPPQALAMADVDGDGRMDLVIDAHDAIEVFRGNGNGTFQGPVFTRIAHEAGFGVMAVGDLNQDGIPDVVLQEFYLNTVNLYFGKGDGTFGAAQVLNFPGDGPAQAIAIADLNGDGIPDLVDDLVEVALGQGHGSFATPIYYPVNGDSLFAGGGAIGLGDFQSKGRVDLVIQSTAIALSILLNNGKGRFIDGVPTPVPGGEVSCTAAGDFNGDGITDLAVSNNASIQIYLGTGKAIAPFKAGATYPFINGGCPTAGDLNGDGKIDLLMPAGNPTMAYAYLGNGDGTFRQGPANPIPELCFFRLADFNGDGKLDYVANINLIAYGNGDGSFSTPVELVPGTTGQAVATTDFNGDGRPDIVATFGGDVLAVLLNNGDGTFQETTTGSCPLADHIAIADANGDGKPDIALGCLGEIGLYLNNGRRGCCADVL